MTFGPISAVTLGLGLGTSIGSITLGYSLKDLQEIIVRNIKGSVNKKIESYQKENYIIFCIKNIAINDDIFEIENKIKKQIVDNNKINLKIKNVKIESIENNINIKILVLD